MLGYRCLENVSTGRGEGAHGNGESAVDRVRTTVGTGGVTVLDGSGKARTYDGSMDTRI